MLFCLVVECDDRRTLHDAERATQRSVLQGGVPA
jgi:hypothetical protein